MINNPDRSAAGLMAADLVALVGSRICHDLISPIGAIGNGVELLQMESATQGPELALISESVTNANARIRFFRIAFGAAGRDQRIARSEVAGILADLYRGSRLAVDWAATGDLPRREAKAVFLLIMCLETAMPYGGRVQVDCTEAGWMIAGRAAKLRPAPDLWAHLADPAHHPCDIGAAQVQFLLAPAEIAAIGRWLTVTAGDGDITLRF